LPLIGGEDVAVDVRFGGNEIAIIGVLLSAVIGALITIFKLLLVAKDAAMADVKAERENYKKAADDAVRMMEGYAAALRQAKGEPPVAPLAAVRPEHQSPVTERELTTAHQATLRAAVTAAALELGLPPRGDASDHDKAAETILKSEAIAAVMKLEPISMPEEKKEGAK
jgi:hypothetical protein